MKVPLLLALVSMTIPCFAQGHDSLKGVGIQELSFLKGDWRGSQTFNTGGAPMVGAIVDHIAEAIGGRYLEEQLSTTLPGRKPTDSHHYITFDPKSGTFRAWWFNDTSVGPMELGGTLDHDKLVMQSPEDGPAGKPMFRATYNLKDPNTLVYTLELKNGDSWRLLFTSSYTK